MDNCVLRLVLYRDKINKSKRKADVPLYQFYLALKKEEQLVLMVEQSHKDMQKLTEHELGLLHKEEKLLNQEKENKIFKEQGPEKLREYREKMEMFARKDDGKDKTLMLKDEYMCRLYELKLKEQNAQVEQAIKA